MHFSGKLFRLFLTIGLTVAWGRDAASADSEIGVPVPDWVKQTDLADIITSEDAVKEEDQFRFLLRDTQYNLTGGPQTSFMRMAFLLKTDLAARALSNLNMIYYGELQTGRVHHVIITRDGEKRDLLPDTVIQTTSQMNNLAQGIGVQMAMTTLQIPALRAGDIVDFAYSIEGPGAPGFEGRRLIVEQIEQYGEPEIFSMRVMASDDAPISFHGYPVQANPAIERKNGVTEYSFVFKKPAKSADPEEDEVAANESDAAAVADESADSATGKPARPDYIWLSDFEKWADVVAWGRRLFDPAVNITPAIAEKTESLLEDAENDRDKLIRIAAFVQDRVRYLGPGLSRNGYRPFQAERTLRLESGDCKDSTVLAIAMLRQAGIDAWAMLVHAPGVESDYGLTQGPVAEAFPTPLNFNHAVVAARVDDEVIWIDPTLPARDPETPSFSLANHMVGLPLREDATTLASQPEAEPRYLADISVYLHIGQSVATISAQFADSYADEMRGIAKLISKKDFGTMILRSYEGWTGETELDGDMESLDNYQDNYFLVTQDLKINDLWKINESEKEEVYAMQVKQNAILNYIPNIKKDHNKDYIFRYFPFKLRQFYDLPLPEAWDHEQNGFAIERDSYEILFHAEKIGARLAIETIFNAKRPYIPASEIDLFRKDRRSFRHDSTQTLWHSPGQKFPLREEFDAPPPDFSMPEPDFDAGMAMPPDSGS